MLRRALFHCAAAPSGGSPHVNVKPVTPAAGVTKPPQQAAPPKAPEQPKVTPASATPPPKPKEAVKEVDKDDGKLSGVPKMGVNPTLYKEQPKKVEEVKVTPTPTPTPSSSSTSSSPATDKPADTPADKSAAQSEEHIQRLLTKQYETLIQMTQDIEIARGNRLAQREITGSTQIRDIPKVAQLVCSSAATTASQRAKNATHSLQALVMDGSKSTLSNAIEKRKQLSEMNRDQQLPWQKNTPRELYVKTGRWFLAQQQGTEAPIMMTALECAILLGIFVYFLLQRRKAKSTAQQVESLIESAKTDADEAKSALESAYATWNTQIVTKNEEIRDVQNNLFEQSCALDKFTTEVLKSK